MKHFDQLFIGILVMLATVYFGNKFYPQINNYFFTSTEAQPTVDLPLTFSTPSPLPDIDDLIDGLEVSPSTDAVARLFAAIDYYKADSALLYLVGYYRGVNGDISRGSVIEYWTNFDSLFKSSLTNRYFVWGNSDIFEKNEEVYYEGTLPTVYAYFKSNEHLMFSNRKTK